MEAFTFLATSEFSQHMADMKLGVHTAGHYDLARMNKEQWIKFRHHFIE
jgi:hypothetical protein